MKIIKARFIGTDSLGYKHNQVYHLIFKELGFIEAKIKGHEIEIWRTETEKESISRTGYCPYSSMTAFLLNWQVAPQLELVVEEHFVHIDARPLTDVKERTKN